MTKVLQEAAYHRNGVGGEGFYVAIFTDTDRTDESFMLTWFPEHIKGEDSLAAYQSRVAVIGVVQAAAGNIHMHPTNGKAGGNAWRGADKYAELLSQIVAWVEEQYEVDLVQVAAPRANLWECEYELDGHDTNGDLWFRCTAHGKLVTWGAMGDAEESYPLIPCEGHVPAPYTGGH